MCCRFFLNFSDFNSVALLPLIYAKSEGVQAYDLLILFGLTTIDDSFGVASNHQLFVGWNYNNLNF